MNVLELQNVVCCFVQELSELWGICICDLGNEMHLFGSLEGFQKGIRFGIVLLRNELFSNGALGKITELTFFASIVHCKCLILKEAKNKQVVILSMEYGNTLAQS